MFKRKVKGRVGRKVRDGDREEGMLGVGEHGCLASGRWKGPLTLQLESPSRRQSRGTSGIASLAADQSASQTVHDVPPHSLNG